MARNTIRALCATALTLAACSSVQVGGRQSPVVGSAGPSGNGHGATPQLVQCQEPIGTIALVESQIAALSQLGLASPVPLIRLVAAQSRCFLVVERGQALGRMLQERQLGGDGMLQQGSNIGVGQIVASDYLITPNIVLSQTDAAGAAAGLRGLSFIPYVGFALAVAGDLVSSLRFSEAQAVMMVTDTRSGVQIAVAEGRAKATDLGGGLGLGSIRGFGSLGAYSNTDQGKVIAGALLDAYNKLVAQLRAQPPR